MTIPPEVILLCRNYMVASESAQLGLRIQFHISPLFHHNACVWKLSAE